MSGLWAKIVLISGILSLIILALIVWRFQYFGIEINIIVIFITILIFISGFIVIRKRKHKSRLKPTSNIEASYESILNSNLNVTVPHREGNTSILSDDSMVLQQSDFSPQVVSAVIENNSKTRDSLIENNEVPPTYEEAKMLPTV